MATSLAICLSERERLRLWWTQTWLVKWIFIRPTLFCSGQGFVIAERSLAVINIDLRGWRNILIESSLALFFPHIVWLSYYSHHIYLYIYIYNHSHLNRSLCFSFFQLTLLFLVREKNSFLLLKTQPQARRHVSYNRSDTPSFTNGYFGVSFWTYSMYTVRSVARIALLIMCSTVLWSSAERPLRIWLPWEKMRVMQCERVQRRWHTDLDISRYTQRQPGIHTSPLLHWL